MNETKRIDPSELDGKEPIATGYKIFGWDWTGYGGYCYADKNGNVEGSVHTVTGKLSKCGWGLHYCENPIDCMRYRDLTQWNKFALVEAYDENIKDDDKNVCRTLKIKKVLSFDEMVKACKSYQVNGSGISYGYGISGGYGIRYGYGISGGYGIRDGYGISYGYGIRDGSGIRYGYGISGGYGIRDGSGISGGYGIRDGYGINTSMHCHKCEGISCCIFCDGLEGAKLMIFNKPVTVERFNEVWGKLNSWKPDFTNAQQLKREYGDDQWASTPVFKITGREASEVYAEMPRELREYIKAMPEYDDEIYKAITGETDE